jgi:hypothetical protein
MSRRTLTASMYSWMAFWGSPGSSALGVRSAASRHWKNVSARWPAATMYIKTETNAKTKPVFVFLLILDIHVGRVLGKDETCIVQDIQGHDKKNKVYAWSSQMSHRRSSDDSAHTMQQRLAKCIYHP